MKYRYLRIGWSSFWAVVCIAVIVFWVRSYTVADGGFVKLAPSFHIQVHAIDGRMCVWFELKPTKGWFGWWSNPIRFETPPDAPNRIPWFDLAFWPTFARLYTAHWFLVVVAAALAAIPWCPRRFTMRGLFVATTAVALLICVIVWVDKTF
jgi:hypothetical protein